MTQHTRPRSSRVLLSVIFFLSGASALIFETLWFRMSGLVFGNSVWGSALVLSSFMAGLAIGNGLASRHGRRIRGPVRAYAGIELLVAVTGVSLVFALPTLTRVLTPLFQPFLERPLLLNGLRFTGSFLLLTVPATAMGMTLPLMVKALLGIEKNFGATLGKLYGWNTLGAVAGALLGEIYLIEKFGLAGSGLCAALLNIVAACSALLIARKLEGAGGVVEPAAEISRALTGRARRILVASFLSGGILLALEVVWFRFMQLFFPGTTLMFSVMLSIVLAGIGIGGLISARWFKTNPTAHRHASIVALVAGAVSVVTYSLFDRALLLRPEAGSMVQIYEVLGLSLCLMFPIALSSGILFSLVGRALQEEVRDATRATGMVTMANTIGAAFGPLIAGFFLIPSIGMERTFFALAGAYGLVAVFLFEPQRAGSATRSYVQPTLAAAFALALALFPFGRMERFLAKSIEPHMQSPDVHVVAVSEGRSETIQYLREEIYGQPLSHRLITNNYSMSATNFLARRYMKYYVYLPVALHPDPKDALLISFGCGSTAKALVDTPNLERIDVVDISREILDMASLVYPGEGENPLDDERIDVHIEDGRFFLQTTDQRYDLITSEPPPPKVAGIVNLYSQEYFQLLHDRLAEGGIATYWLPVNQLEVAEAKSILKAFLNVFGDETTLWTGSGYEWMLVGSRNAKGPVTREQFGEQWNLPRVAREMRALGFEEPGQIGATFLMGAEDLRELTAESLPLTDNYPQRLSTRLAQDMDSVMAYALIMNTLETRGRFERSSFVQRVWPESLRVETLNYFTAQEAINQVAFNAAASMMDFSVLHFLLTATSLEVPILWSCGSNATRQSILEAAPHSQTDNDPVALYFLGIGALATRDYQAAEDYLSRSDLLEPRPDFLPARLFLLCMARNFDAARSLQEAHANWFDADPSRKNFLVWLNDTIEVGTPGS